MVCLSKTHTHKWSLYSEFTLFSYNYGLSLSLLKRNNNKLVTLFRLHRIQLYGLSLLKNNNKLVTLFRLHFIQLYGLSLSLS